ncbi:MAG: ABC transporter permease subunit, partial [Ruminococcus sp.]|nr:ABC transporter permease subunit [Ruminococcus sp.]
TIDFSGLDSGSTTLRYITASTMQPYSYIKDGQNAGLEADIVARFCKEYGYGLRIDNADFAGLIPGIAGGTYDIASGTIMITEERAQSVDFSDVYYTGEAVSVVRKENLSSVQTAAAPQAVEDRTLGYYAANGKIGAITGGLYEIMIRERYPEAEILQYNSQPDLAIALSGGKIDAFTCPKSSAEDFMAADSSLTYLNEIFMEIPYGFAFKKCDGENKLRDQMNEFLAKLHADGTYDEIVDTWFGTDESKKTIDFSGLDSGSTTLRYITASTMQPYSYIKDGQNAGLEADIVARFCKEYGYGLRIDNADFAGLIPGIAGGTYDIASGTIMITEERAQSVDFSDVYYTGEAVSVVRKEKTSSSDASSDIDPLSFNKSEYTIGVPTGASSMYAVEQLLPNAKLLFFDDEFSAYESVRLGKLDAFCYDRLRMQVSIDSGFSGVRLLNGNLGDDINVAVGISRSSSIPDLKGKINAFLAELRKDGTIDEMLDRWTKEKNYEMPDIPDPESPEMTIVVGTTGTIEPYSFYIGEKLTGFELELVKRFALYMNAKIEYRIYNFSGIITAAGSSEIDCIFSNLNVTPERAEKIDFSDPIYTMQNTLMVSESRYPLKLDTVSENTDDTPEKTSFIEDIKESFNKNFVREDRYKLILEGIGTTCIITVLSVICGSILAFLICLFRRADSVLSGKICDIYVKLLQGTPMVVLLMILYYVIFGKSGMAAMWVAVIGFSLNFGAYVSEILRSGIESIDGGQREAALALGFSENQSFFRFIFPQAAVRQLPVYRGEIISLLKNTSIVGYIAIQDLTKMSDIIRSRTYEAFFPLIVTAVIYFILAWIISLILKFVLKQIDPRSKKRGVKGVTLK